MNPNGPQHIPLRPPSIPPQFAMNVGRQPPPMQNFRMMPPAPPPPMRAPPMSMPVPMMGLPPGFKPSDVTAKANSGAGARGNAPPMPPAGRGAPTPLPMRMPLAPPHRAPLAAPIMPGRAMQPQGFAQHHMRPPSMVRGPPPPFPPGRPPPPPQRPPPSHMLAPAPMHAPVPPQIRTPWMEVTDEDDGATFFFNRETGETTWKRPAVLRTRAPFPLGEDEDSVGDIEPIKGADIQHDGGRWVQVRRPGEAVYYHNQRTGASTYVPPTPSIRKWARRRRREERRAEREAERIEAQMMGQFVPMEEEEDLDSSVSSERGVPNTYIPDSADVSSDSSSSEDEDEKEFRTMLLESDLSSTSTWEQCQQELATDARFSAVERVAVRRRLFEAFLKERMEEDRRKEREARERELKEREAKRVEALRALEECDEKALERVRPSDTFESYRRRVRKSKVLEALALNDEDLASVFEEALLSAKERRRAEREERRAAFVELLKEHKSIDASSRWSRTRARLRDDERFRALDDDDERAELFYSYVDELREQDNDDAERRAVKRRRKEVSESSAAREHSQERTAARRAERESELRALFAERVKEPTVLYSDARRRLESDARLEARDDDRCGIDESVRQRLYMEHLKELMTKRLEAFRTLCDEMLELYGHMAEWDDLDTIVEDRRYQLVGLESDRKHLFEERKEAMRDRLKDAFRSLLKESKQTLSSTPLPPLSSDEDKAHFAGTMQVLRQDARYKALEGMEEWRDEYLLDYMRQLHKESKERNREETVVNPTRDNVKETHFRPRVLGTASGLSAEQRRNAEIAFEQQLERKRLRAERDLAVLTYALSFFLSYSLSVSCCLFLSLFCCHERALSFLLSFLLTFFL